jgi:hypothetical protein
MLLLLRDEDLTTVASVITAIALQNGLETVDPDNEPQDILSLAAMLVGPRVVLVAGDDFVIASALESLDIGDVGDLGQALSSACGNEVVAITPTGDGIRVLVFDDGELDEDVAVNLSPSGKTSSAALAEIAPTEEAAAELTSGLSVLNAIELAERVLALFGAPPERYRGEPTTLSFRAPEIAT